MVKVCVLQTDNRPSLDYLLKTQEVNKKICDYLGYDYLFIEITNECKFTLKQYEKLYVVNSFLQNVKYDILVFLDSDAWIQNGFWLNDIINNLVNNENKHGCFSRDPYVKKNTFINSGSFILKVNDFTRKMYNELISNFEEDLKKNNNNDVTVRNKNKWCDQYYVSRYVFKNKDNFNIFIPDILNTPLGKVLRHNWFKSKRMYSDLKLLNLIKPEEQILNNSTFIMEEYYDTEIFPNTNVKGYEYDS